MDLRLRGKIGVCKILNEEYNSSDTQIAARIISDESMIVARKKWKLAMKKKVESSKKVATMELNLDG